MKPTMISYQKLFPLGIYINERIGIEMQLDDGDSPEVALSKAKEIVHKFHKDSNPELVDSQPLIPSPELPITQVKKDSKEEAIQRMINEINACANKKTLDSYKLIAKTSPELQEAFDNKLKQLQ